MNGRAEKTDLKSLSAEDLSALLRGMEISLKYAGSRTAKRQAETLIQKCIDEKQRRNEAVRQDYYRKMRTP